MINAYPSLEMYVFRPLFHGQYCTFWVKHPKVAKAQSLNCRKAVHCPLMYSLQLECPGEFIAGQDGSNCTGLTQLLIFAISATATVQHHN
eukprot:s2021_g8.t1